MNSPRKAARLALNAVLLLDKPQGLTSNAALQRVRRLFNAAKAGHTGTLDPLATGLLPVCFGEATKFSADLLHADKTYDAVIELGSVTDTGDADGQVLRRAEVAVTRDRAAAALARFQGEIFQVPPMHSALKHQGRPLYSYAREGIDVARAAREISIRRLELVEFSGTRLRVEVECSKGTYVRTLAQDIGEALGCGAHLAALRRIKVGDLEIAAAVPLAALESMPEEERAGLLLPVDSLVSRLPMLSLDADAARRFLQGQAIAAQATEAAHEIRVYVDGRFVGVAWQDATGLAPRRLLAQPAEPRSAGAAGASNA